MSNDQERRVGHILLDAAFLMDEDPDLVGDAIRRLSNEPISLTSSGVDVALFVVPAVALLDRALELAAKCGLDRAEMVHDLRAQLDQVF